VSTASRPVVIAGNWKMHMTCAEARAFAQDFMPLVANTPTERTVVLAPPFTAIAAMEQALSGSRVQLSSQNVHWEGKGAFTGEISPAMLQEFGVTYTIVGHSEPRKYFSESEEQINHRARASQAAGLIPILCVGESDSQREAGETERVIRRQVEQGMDGIDPSKLVVAYEPIWAIGTGKTCASDEANRVCGLIRNWVGYPDLTIQYGGSVKPGNIDELMAQSDIDGVLVGGASLDPVGFARIANYEVSAAA
jgi:triosephosphate isomerase